MKFHQRKQQEEESVNNFGANLNKLSRYCKFPENWPLDALCTQFISGVRSEDLRLLLLNSEDITYKKAVEMAAAYETNRQVSRSLAAAPGAKVELDVCTSSVQGADSVLPRFAEPIPNVTVTIGRDALMACVVDNLRNYKVAWVRVDTQTILSIHHHVITQNPRVSLSYNDHRSWYLHISNVQEVDRGWYMCQVNTDPMRHRAGYLQVVVPPRIVGGDGSRELVVRESTEVRLECRAEGYPEPYVMWRREDGKDMNYNGDVVNVVDGEILHITRVSRLHMGAYLCIASNGVPPSISRRILLRVQFPPMLSIPNQLEGAYPGQNVSLECQTEAFPSSINYWTTDNGDMIVSGEKFETSTKDHGYSKYMVLRIRNVTSRDFGSYQCVAKNSLGETDGVIKLEEIPNPIARTTATTLSSADKGRNKFIQERYSKEENEAHKGSKVVTVGEREVIVPTPARPPADRSSSAILDIPPLCLLLLTLLLANR